MGAIIVSISVSVIAIIGSIFFYLEDKRKKQKMNTSDKIERKKEDVSRNDHPLSSFFS
jgi:hypothetical protein